MTVTDTTKGQITVHRHGYSPTHCYFSDGSESRAFGVSLLTAQWKEMGKPETLIVTIEPGDHLNTEDEPLDDPAT